MRALWRTVASTLYCRRLQHITVQPIAADAAMAKRASEDGTVECVIVSPLEALEGLAPRISTAFRDSVRDLARRVAGGCVLTVVLRRRERGMSEVVGYELAEQGVFSALGRRRHISSEVVFSHWAEVLPAYRGRRIHALLFATRDAYFSERGGKIVVGVAHRAIAPRSRRSRAPAPWWSARSSGRRCCVTRSRGRRPGRTSTTRCCAARRPERQSKVSTVRATSPAFIARNASLRSSRRPRRDTISSSSRRP